MIKRAIFISIIFGFMTQNLFAQSYSVSQISDDATIVTTTGERIQMLGIKSSNALDNPLYSSTKDCMRDIIGEAIIEVDSKDLSVKDGVMKGYVYVVFPEELRANLDLYKNLWAVQQLKKDMQKFLIEDNGRVFLNATVLWLQAGKVDNADHSLKESFLKLEAEANAQPVTERIPS